MQSSFIDIGLEKAAFYILGHHPNVDDYYALSWRAIPVMPSMR